MIVKLPSQGFENSRVVAQLLQRLSANTILEGKYFYLKTQFF